VIHTEEKNKATFLEILQGIKWQGILLCIMSFFVGRVCIFDTFYTVGISYVGAMYWDKGSRRWSAILTALGILSLGIINVQVVKYLLILILLAAFREVMGVLKYQFNRRNQLVIFSISMLAINGINLLMQDFTMYKLILGILDTAIGLGLMGIFSIALSVIYENKKSILSEHELASIAFLMAVYLCGIIDIYIGVPIVERVYIKDVFVFILLIGAIYMGGLGSGMVVSVIVSTILVVIGYMPTGFIGIYVFAALIGGLFTYLNRIGIIFATTLGLLLGFALFNNRMIDFPILGAYMCAALISLIIPKHYFGVANWFGQGVEVEEAKHLINVQAIVTGRLSKFAEAFERVSKEFSHMTIKDTKLDVKQMNQIIEDTGESLCKDCTMCQFCWIDYLKDTYRSSYKMIEVLESKGQILVGDIPEEFKKACVRPESFAYALGLKLDVFKQDCKWQKHFDEARGLIAEEFKGISESVEKLSKELNRDFYFNKEEEKKIRLCLQGMGIRTRDIMVLEESGNRCQIHIYTYYKGEPDYKEKVIEAVEKALNLKIEIKKYEYFIEDQYCYFEFGIKKQFSISVSAQNKAKNGVCGDVSSFMELEDGRYLLALADGMGSGKAARKESERAIELLECLLESGFESEVALRMINSALILKSEVECYTTMDMGLLDQHTGVISFLKMGASTSFIVRENEIITVKASSLPIGILSHVDLVSCKKQLKDGDIIIMVTDGILENRNDLSDGETTFKHFIAEAKSNNPEYMAKFLLNKAKNLLAGQEGDDMTVVVARVWKQY